MLNDFQISVKSGPAQKARGQLRSLQPALFQFFVDVTAVFLAVLIAHIGVQALSSRVFPFPLNPDEEAQILAGILLVVPLLKAMVGLYPGGSSWVSGCWRRSATIGPMSDGRLWFSSVAFGCCNGRHRPSAGTDHDFAADDQSDVLDR